MGEIEFSDAGLVEEEAAAVVADDEVDLVGGALEEEFEESEGVACPGGAGDTDDKAAG